VVENGVGKPPSPGSRRGCTGRRPGRALGRLSIADVTASRSERIAGHRVAGPLHLTCRSTSGTTSPMARALDDSLLAFASSAASGADNCGSRARRATTRTRPPVQGRR